MSDDRREVAEVPVTRRADGICWLVLEPDSDSGGWFLFGHRTLESASEFDSWHLKRDEALQEAEVQWGVGLGDWRVDLG